MICCYFVMKSVKILESLNGSVNQYFPNEQYVILQNHAWVKDPCKVQDRPISFIVTNNQKFIDRVANICTLKITFKKLILIEYSIESKKSHSSNHIQKLSQNGF